MTTKDYSTSLEEIRESYVNEKSYKDMEMEWAWDDDLYLSAEESHGSAFDSETDEG